MSIKAYPLPTIDKPQDPDLEEAARILQEMKERDRIASEILEKMAIEIREVSTKKDLRTYIYLPEKIHKNHKNWLPPVYMDEWTFYNTKKNKCFSYSDTILVLAYRGDEPVGRVMGIINN